MPADIAGDLAAAGRMSDQHDVVQVQRLDHCGQVVRVVVEVVAVPGLAGPAATATVVSDGAEAVGCDEIGWPVPYVGGQRPAVAEDDRLPAAPVLVEDLDVVAILLADGDCCHRKLPFCLTYLSVLLPVPAARLPSTGAEDITRSVQMRFPCPQ